MFAALWAFLWPGWDAVYPNLLASALCVIPSFLAHHLALRRHINRLHQAHQAKTFRALLRGVRIGQARARGKDGAGE